MPKGQNNRFFVSEDFPKGNTLPLLCKIYKMPAQNNAINITGTELGMDNSIFFSVKEEKKTK